MTSVVAASRQSAAFQGLDGGALPNAATVQGLNARFGSVNSYHEPGAQSGAEATASPNASRLPAIPELREASGVRSLQRRCRSGSVFKSRNSRRNRSSRKVRATQFTIKEWQLNDSGNPEARYPYGNLWCHSR